MKLLVAMLLAVILTSSLFSARTSAAPSDDFR